jgi:hypothetical protein
MKLQRALTYIIAIVAMLAINGCAFDKMSLTGKSESIDVTEKSMVLLTVKLVNQVSPRYQPDIINMNIEPKNERKPRLFKMDDEGRFLSDSGNEFLYRISMPPGKYIIRAIAGESKHFPVMSNFLVPIHTDLDVPAGKIIYIGRISAVNRARTGNEERAGMIFPLIDQAVAGFSGGTWDVEVIDNQDEDMQSLKNRFVALQNASVEKQILPAWDRARAKRGWDYH